MQIYVSHGMVTHPMSEKWKCEECKKTEEEFQAFLAQSVERSLGKTEALSSKLREGSYETLLEKTLCDNEEIPSQIY